MVIVPESYTKAMDKIGRNPSYTQVTVGVVNPDGQARAEYESTGMVYFGSLSNLKQGIPVEVTYATCEPGYCKCDGSQLILPEPSSGLILAQGYISSQICDTNGVFEDEPKLTVTFGGELQNAYGFTLDFDAIENIYPTRFTVEYYKEQELVDSTVVEDNDRSRLELVKPVQGFDEVVFTFHQMSNPLTRMRLSYILHGIGLMFNNYDIVSSTLSSEINPVSAVLPTCEFTVGLNNYTHRFDMEDPTNVVQFLQNRQPLQVQYGYDTGNGIYWVNGGSYILSGEVTCGEETLDLTAGTVLDFMTDKYQQKSFSTEGISAYDLAEDIIKDAIEHLPDGVSLEYLIDPYFKDVIVYAPMPRESYATCLQYLAVLCRSALYVDRTGRLILKSTFSPEATVTDNNHTEYSSAAKLVAGYPLEDYSTFEAGVNTVDNATFILPESDFVALGYVSADISDQDGVLHSKPTITLQLEASYVSFGLSIKFGRTQAASFTVSTYLDDQLVEQVSFKNKVELFNTSRAFKLFDKMVIQFESMVQPNARLRLKQIQFGSATNYTLYRCNTSGTPTVSLLAAIRQLGVLLYSVQKESKSSSIADTAVHLPSGVEVTVELTYSDPCTDQQVQLPEGVQLVNAVHTLYSSTITMTSNTDLDAEVSVTGKKIVTSESSTISEAVLASGDTDVIDNPLITTRDQALDVLQWMIEYVTKRRIYEVPYRGDFILDPADIINYETRSGEIIQTRIVKCVTDSGQGLSGTLQLKEESIRVDRTENQLGIYRYLLLH